MDSWCPFFLDGRRTGFETALLRGPLCFGTGLSSPRSGASGNSLTLRCLVSRTASCRPEARERRWGAPAARPMTDAKATRRGAAKRAAKRRVAGALQMVRVDRKSHCNGWLEWTHGQDALFSSPQTAWCWIFIYIYKLCKFFMRVQILIGKEGAARSFVRGWAARWNF